MTISLSEIFQRTDAGRSEIHARALPLTRPARNLLLVIDGSSNGLQWLGKVHGTSEADLRQLIEAGLVAPTGAGAATPRAAQPGVTLDQALEKMSYDALYTLLTHEARERFGLIKGYRLILEIEGASDIKGLQAIARKFVELIRKTHGEEPAVRFRRQLGARD